VLTVRAWGDRRPAPRDGEPQHAPAEALGPVEIRETLRLPAVWFGALAFATYVAIEVAAGLWAFLLLTEGRHLPAAAAGVCVSGYWGSLFVGRVVQGLVAERLGSDRVLRGSLVGIGAGSVLVALPGPAWLAVAGLLIIGFAVAPGISAAHPYHPRSGRRRARQPGGVQIGAAGLGGALVPAGVGVLLTRVGVEALGPALVGLSLVLLALDAASNPRSAAQRAASAA
jgi:fucose permease